MFVYASAQAQQVTGVVTDINGQPLANVSIKIQETDFKTFSTADGSFVITVPSNKKVLIFHLDEYLTLKLSIDNEIINVRMVKDNSELVELTISELFQLEITTASKKTEKIADIPASVELITRADIEMYGYTSLEEIIANVTGYYSMDNLSYTNSLAGVRGFMSQNGTGVIILINGVSQLRKGLESYSLRESSVPVESIDRIEIIRGPMSVMYGTGAFFGVINIITDKYELDKFHGHIAVSAGSLETKKTSASVSGKEGNLNYSMNAGYYSSYGRNFSLSEMTDNLSPNSPSDSDGRLEGWDKYFDMSIDMKSFYCKVTFFEMMQEVYGIIPSREDGGHHENSRLNMMIGFNKSFTDKLNLNASFRYNVLNEYLDIHWLKDDYYAKQDLRGTSYEAELRLNYKPTEKLDLTLGLTQNSLLDYFMIWDYTAFGGFYNNHLRQLDTKNNINNMAGFFQAEYSPFKKLKIIGGFRLEKMSDYDFLQSFGSDTTGNNGNATRTTLYGQYKSEGASFIPRVAVLFQLNKSNSIKFFYGEAIKHPAFDENSQNIKDINRYGNLEDEKIRTFELNYTTTISSKLNIKASLFRNNLTNLISRLWETELDGSIVSHQENAGVYLTHGAELSLSFSPIDNFKMKLSGSYQKSEDKREGFENVDVAYSPNFLGYASLLYKIKKYSISLSGNYVDKMESFWSGQAPGQENAGGRIGHGSDAYFILSSNLRIRDLFNKGIFLNLTISNILDQKYTIPASSLHLWAEKGNPGYGRMFLFSLGYKF